MKYYRMASLLKVASLVGITERESGVGKLCWHGNFMEFDRKIFIFFYIAQRKKEERLVKLKLRLIRTSSNRQKKTA